MYMYMYLWDIPGHSMAILDIPPCACTCALELYSNVKKITFLGYKVYSINFIIESVSNAGAPYTLTKLHSYGHLL